MSKVVDYWESEGFLFLVPEELKEIVANALEVKSRNVRNGKDFKDQPEDYDQLVIDYLDSLEGLNDNEELLDED